MSRFTNNYPKSAFTVGRAHRAALSGLFLTFCWLYLLNESIFGGGLETAAPTGAAEVFFFRVYFGFNYLLTAKVGRGFAEIWSEICI